MKYTSHKTHIKHLGFWIALALCLTNSAIASTLEEVVVMSISAADGRAVVKTADGAMHVLAEGDVIPGLAKENKTIIQQIQPGRLVVSTLIEKGKRKQTAWIFPPKQIGGKSRIQRLDRMPPVEKPMLYKVAAPSDEKGNSAPINMMLHRN